MRGNRKNNRPGGLSYRRALSLDVNLQISDLVDYALEFPVIEFSTLDKEEKASYRRNFEGVIVTAFVSSIILNISLVSKHRITPEVRAIIRQSFGGRLGTTPYYYNDSEENGYFIWRYRYEIKEITQARYEELPENRCHICHRELTDPKSLKVKIGPDCREKLETLEGVDKSFWKTVDDDKLKELHKKYNNYHGTISGRFNQ